MHLVVFLLYIVLGFTSLSEPVFFQSICYLYTQNVCSMYVDAGVQTDSSSTSTYVVVLQKPQRQFVMW